ncbi:MAG: glutamine-hydrolyzing GMP synthase [Candidatus Moranbacteria bacterium]|nr:glutamine-hydrolyzing GMP synthase [Candidatus Moranbacteria bacterium]
MQKKDQIIILNFGSQTTQLIAKSIRSLGIYSQILDSQTPATKIKKIKPCGIIFSGGPNSVTQKKSPRPDPAVYKLNIPILGICYGLQLITQKFSGQVAPGKNQKEYGQAKLTLKQKNNTLIKNLPDQSFVWMSHGDEINQPPKDFKVIASTAHSPYAIVARPKKNIYAVQFHPEVTHTQFGQQILRNFAINICGCAQTWQTPEIIQFLIQKTKRIAQGRQVLHAISGGVDSTVMAEILHQALGHKLRCVMVDTGFLRQNEVEKTQKRFKKYLSCPVEVVNAREQFFNLVKNVQDAEKRRKLIGRQYIKIFLKLMGQNDLLAQGTLYPDVIESASCGNSYHAHTIKTHHNRAQEVIKLMRQNRVIEVFKNLFKDEVRAIGKKLQLPQEVVMRQPFPGPGLAIRILGPITKPKLRILKQADAIVIQQLKKSRLYYKISQTVVALDSHQATCVKGDAREKGYLIFIRNISTQDFMTVAPYYLPRRIRENITTAILNQVKGVGRVLFDESTKPPATICYM